MIFRFGRVAGRLSKPQRMQCREIARRHGCTFMHASDGVAWWSWFETRSQDDELDQQLERAVLAEAQQLGAREPAQ